MHFCRAEVETAPRDLAQLDGLGVSNALRGERRLRGKWQSQMALSLQYVARARRRSTRAARQAVATPSSPSNLRRTGVWQSQRSSLRRLVCIAAEGGEEVDKDLCMANTLNERDELEAVPGRSVDLGCGAAGCWRKRWGTTCSRGWRSPVRSLFESCIEIALSGAAQRCCLSLHVIVTCLDGVSCAAQICPAVVQRRPRPQDTHTIFRDGTSVLMLRAAPIAHGC